MMHQPNRHDKEYQELTRLLSEYDAFTIAQAEQLFPELPVEKCHFLIKKLQKQGRAYINDQMITRQEGYTPTKEQIAAFWVMLDFIPKIVYHTPGTYPIQIAFFAEEESYEILYASEEKEVLFTHTLNNLPLEKQQKRIVIVDAPKQITRLSLSNVTAYCTVNPDGKVTYFNLQGA